MMQPKTGQPCDCKRGVQRDNCPTCEGTGMMIDFKAIRAATAARVVAECWTCAYRSMGPDHPQRADYEDIGSGFVLRLNTDAAKQHHRAAGHDVREVTR